MTIENLSELRRDLDKGDMLGLVTSFPDHMQDAWRRGNAVADGLSTTPVSRIVVCGMGGSAIGGDMVRSFLGDRLCVPLFVNRGYEVPSTHIRDSFFIFSSYSGDTGETLTSYDSVRKNGAPSVAITTGGALGERCREDGVPVCAVPKGMPPRAAIAYSFFPLLLILDAVGAATFDEHEFERAHSVMKTECRKYRSDDADNKAMEIARRLVGRLPFIYSCGGLFAAVGRRWACQLNENGKSLSHYAEFPELGHNEIVGWKSSSELNSRIAVVVLEDEDDHPLVRRQAQAAMRIIEPYAGPAIRVAGFTGDRLERILSAMILGDFVSVYVAYLTGEDPTPVVNIDNLKKRLRR